MVVMVSFLELTGPALHDERCWLTLATIRSRELAQVAGGFSRFLAHLLKELHESFAVRGVALPGAHMLYAAPALLLTDQEGFQYSLKVKGYSGTRPCIKCYNVWMKGRAPPDPDHVDITCGDFGRLQFLKRETLVAYVERLRTEVIAVARGEKPKKDLEELEKALGINADLRTIMSDQDLNNKIDLLGSVRFDWMHGFLSHGTMADEVRRLLEASPRVGIRIEQWRQVCLLI